MSLSFSNRCRNSISKMNHFSSSTYSSSITSSLTSTKTSKPQRFLSNKSQFSTSSIQSQAPKPISTLPSSQALAKTKTPKSIKEQVELYPQHPLLQFFQQIPLSSTISEDENSKKDKSDSTEGELLIPSTFSNYDTNKTISSSSRGWLAPELRLKSSHELHVLWYVLLLERNRLATSWDEVARVGARNLVKRSGENLSKRNHRVKKSMARIKFVLNERRLALIGAQKAVRSGTSSLEDDPMWEDVSDELDGKEVTK